MKLIETKFDYDDFTFWLIMRQGDLALFAKTKPNHSRWSFELVVLQKHEARTFPSGKSYPEREAMPTNEQWGESGWTPFSYEHALARFEEKVLERRLTGFTRYQHVDLEAFAFKDNNSASLPAMEIPARATSIELPARPREKGSEENCV